MICCFVIATTVSHEAIQLYLALDCFADLVTGLAISGRTVGSQ
jgi:hypothetical protein